MVTNNIQMMNFIFLITLMLFVGFLNAINLKDDIHVVCKSSEDGLPVYVPHPYECNKYFECVGIDGVLMTCPEKLGVAHFLYETSADYWIM